jgi:hypothetical protein
MKFNFLTFFLSFLLIFSSTPGSSRRESVSGGPPSMDPRGSIHNLQLDIMDDIVTSRKARMKLWNTSTEKVCEVQTVDEAGSSTPQRYTNARRFSDFVQSTLAPIPQHRRASENPSMLSPNVSRAPSPSPSKKAGIICSNTDLISLLSSLASSATEINRINEVPTPIQTQPPKTTTSSSSATSNNNFLRPERKTSLKKSNRSNSFDVSILQGVKQQFTGEDKSSAASGSGWFTKRHIPASKRQNTVKSSAQATVSFARETFDKLTDSSSSSKETPTKEKANAKVTGGKKKEHKSPLNRLKWDGRSAIVDARIIGSAIEGFLRTGSLSSSSSSKSSSKDASRTAKKSTAQTKTGWFSKTEDEDSSGDTCDTSSLCATLKDLFVK